MKHNYNSENKCVNCGAYRDAVMAGNLLCFGTPYVTVKLSTDPPCVQLPEGETTADDYGRACRPQQQKTHIPISLGERVKLLAQAAGLTETGAAAVMGCSVRDVAMIVSGEQDITSDQLMALAVETFKSVYRAFQKG